MNQLRKKKVDVCLLHMERLVKLKGEKVAIMEMRKHAAWYLKGLKDNGRVRNRINQIETKEAMEDILFEYVNELELATYAS